MPDSKVLKIVDLKGEWLGVILQSENGKLELEVKDTNCQEELSALVEKIQQQDIFLIGGTKISRGEQEIHQTVRTKILPGTSEYLKAVQDWILRSRQVIKGRRIRALLIVKEQI